MHPEVDELRPKLKEVLYDCALEIRATKAALYVLDGNVKKYELVSEFGFRSGVRQTVGENDPMVDRCARGRSPFYVNNPAMEPRLSQLLFEASTERLMGVPLFSRGLLVGFIDMRDKAQKQAFDQFDIGKAQTIADRILALFATKNIWNQRSITLSETSLGGTPPPSAATSRVSSAPPVIQSGRENEPAKIVAAARAATAHLAAPPPPGVIGESEMSAIADSLRAVLLLPGAIAAVFSATGQSGGVQEVASRGTMTQDALSALQLKLQTWLAKRGESVGALKTTLHNPLGLSVQPITAMQLEKVLTAAVSVADFRGLYLTVAFTGNPDRGTHDLLAALLNHLQTAIESSTLRARLQNVRMQAAERLLEPSYTSYPELRRHAAGVVELAEEFARFLSLPDSDIATIKLAAMVHDSGMRFLDYEKLYRKKDLSHDELALLREHVVVGAALVEPLLGPEVARAVLCHHERVDGAGYPNELRGESIPLESRVLQICDVYLAITDPATYQTPEPPEAAIAAIRRGAGAQFDSELAVRFEQMMRGRVQSTKLANR